MRDMIKLFIAVTIFAAISGGLLATVKSATEEKIEYNKLKFVIGPTIISLLEGSSNDPLVDRFKLPDEEIERDFFVGAFDGKSNTVAFESFGKGYGGDIGVIVAVNIETDEIVGVGVTTHSETPGMGSRAKTEPEFCNQFKGISIKDPFKVRPDGGNIDAISGATITSRAVCNALSDLSNIYDRLKSEIAKKIKA